MSRIFFGMGCPLVLLLALPATAQEGGQPTGDKGSFLIDAGGKEVPLKSWKFVRGTRRLPGLDGKVQAKGPASGPEYLEFREDNSTTFKDGILTLVPTAILRRLDYDEDKKTVRLTVMGSNGKDLALSGTTKFVGINKLDLEVEAEIPNLGAAALKFKAGYPGGIRGLQFAGPKPGVENKGEKVMILAADKEKTTHQVSGLAALYLAGATEITLPHLLFKTTVKIDLDKIQNLKHLPSDDKKQVSRDYEVTLNDGQKLSLTMLDKASGDDGKTLTLVGLVGRVPAGFKLFPAHTIAELRVGDPGKD